ncbi:MAG TPA: hypothetical protein DD803_04030 [Alcaligenes faecalis]|uniref:Uncharacterized protein n=1 Tax=Alcaligenes aquatilis TaxID=323284 RepID=A0A3G2HVV0_9BURK|nr:hypothetical protein D3M96_12625 [Alcaligenes aquatilis]HBQ88614.1 hypothetical protein [Alcaligenes faecalis]
MIFKAFHHEMILQRECKSIHESLNPEFKNTQALPATSQAFSGLFSASFSIRSKSVQNPFQ